MLYNAELYKWVDQLINEGPERYTDEYRKLAESSQTDDQEKCFLIASRLRKRGHTSDAYLASKLLSKVHPSLKSFNIYLISAYDLTYKGNKETYELYDVLQEAWNFYISLPYEPNITATLLKCCNYLIQDNYTDLVETFNQIYEKCPPDERSKNSFIVAQHFKRLVADGKEQQVLTEFRKLSPQLQSTRTLLDIVNRLVPKHDILSKHFSYSQKAPRSRKITIISTDAELLQLKDILDSFTVETAEVEINSPSLIEDLNQSTYKSGKAVITVPAHMSDDNYLLSEAWAFVLGYCIHKFGKGNTILLVHENNRVQEGSILKEYTSSVYKDQIDLIKFLASFGVIS